jgi:hypothetical protein
MADDSTATKRRKARLRRVLAALGITLPEWFMTGATTADLEELKAIAYRARYRYHDLTLARRRRR